MPNTGGGQMEKMAENPQKDQAWEWLKKGLALMGEGQYEQAVSAFNQSLDHDPYLAATFNNKGVCLTRLGRRVEAMGCFDRALELNPSDGEALTNRGCTLSEIGLHREAVEDFERALALSYQTAETWNGKGIALDGLGKFRAAIDCFEQALQVNPKHLHAWFNKAESLYNAARYAEAIEAYRKFITIVPPESAGKVDRANAMARYAEIQMGKGVKGLAFRLLGEDGQTHIRRGIEKLRTQHLPQSSIFIWTCEEIARLQTSGQPPTPQTLQPLIEGIVARMPARAKEAVALREERDLFPSGTFVRVYERALYQCYHASLLSNDDSRITAKAQIHRKYWSIETRFPGLAEALFKTAGEAPFVQPAVFTPILTQLGVADELKRASRQGKEALAEALMELQARQLPKAG